MVQSSTPRICDHQVTINIGADSSGSYVRRLGVFDTTMVVVGGIIGAGIFLNPAIVAQRVHTTAFILAAWIIGGAIALIGALTFAQLGARRPQAGGGYIYLNRRFDRAGWFKSSSPDLFKSKLHRPIGDGACLVAEFNCLSVPAS
jgi:amino acid permease